MTDSTQELDDILDDFYTKAINGMARTWTKSQAKQAIIEWHNKQVEEVLDRLIAQQWSFGENDDALAVPIRYIEAERNKLKESKNDQL